MNRELNVAEAREFFETEKVFEISEGFLYNCAGKYEPNMSFLLPLQFELDATGKIVNPLTYISDPAVTDSFNLRLDGEASFLFGDFWRSKKGGACFRPKDPQQAKHLLVRVDWGGCFNRSRGQWADYAKEAGALYFKRASSNGGGSGYDYWVLPVGYVRQYDSEQAFRIDRKLATEYCERHSALQAEERAEADRLLKEKLAAEAASVACRERYVGELANIAKELDSIDAVSKYYTYRIKLQEKEFLLGSRQMLYTEENLQAARDYLQRQRKALQEYQAEQAQIRQQYAEFAPKFQALQERALAAGLQISTTDLDKASLKTISGGFVADPAYSVEGVQLCESKIREKELEAQEEARRQAKLDAEAAAKVAGLPSDVRIWHRTGRTNAGCGWVISPEGMERECDEVDTSMHSSSSKRYHQNYEGDHVWRQILPGELVVRWHKAYTAADHELEVIYCPEVVTEAQLERLAELLEEVNADWRDCTGLVSKTLSPLIDIERFLAQFVA